jgi:hypothetical protein
MAIDAAREIIEDARRRRVTATTGRPDATGRYDVVEVDGVLFRRESDQELARAHVEHAELWDEIRGYGVSHELLLKMEMATARGLLEEFEHKLRSIGHLLIFHGQHALWQLVYLEAQQEDCYALGDEMLFLQHLPTSGHDDYEGPPSPGHRLNSAVERAAEMRRRAVARVKQP